MKCIPTFYPSTTIFSWVLIKTKIATSFRFRITSLFFGILISLSSGLTFAIDKSNEKQAQTYIKQNLITYHGTHWDQLREKIQDDNFLKKTFIQISENSRSIEPIMSDDDEISIEYGALGGLARLFGGEKSPDKDWVLSKIKQKMKEQKNSPDNQLRIAATLQATGRAVAADLLLDILDQSKDEATLMPLFDQANNTFYNDSEKVIKASNPMYVPTAINPNLAVPAENRWSKADYERLGKKYHQILKEKENLILKNKMLIDVKYIQAARERLGKSLGLTASLNQDDFQGPSKPVDQSRTRGIASKESIQTRTPASMTEQQNSMNQTSNSYKFYLLVLLMVLTGGFAVWYFKTR